ncbi:cytochrome P450 family protein [Thalassoroseus pseudoceratinae]|uniref:cytochrome P450 family protein n=1 Tax=Thalassoroseus pseudoceratinae TaxID=2713176 RepID=UPI00141D81A8|nr:cytochrome P450 [Thalassoroseus pseudoceratinae]
MQKIDLVSQDFKRNPLPTFAALREQGPLIETRLPIMGRTRITTDYETTVAVLRDSERFVTSAHNAGRKQYAGMQWWMPRTITTLANNMLTKDDPDHRRLRKLAEAAFLRRSVDDMQPRLEQLAHTLLDQVEAIAKRDGQVDFVEHFARPFPLAVISELLGLPEEDRPVFGKWGAALTQTNSVLAVFRFLPLLRKMYRYFERQFEECRQNPRPGLLTALVQAEQAGDQLSHEELIAFAFLLLFAGHETTVHLTSGGLLTLLEHPEQKAELLADWSLVGGAVQEALRFYCPVQMTKPRYIREDTELVGVSLRRGEMISAILAAANLDPAEFENPGHFDIRRQPNPHVAFGTGMHVCLGMKLANAEVETAFRCLFTRFPKLELAIPSSELKWAKRIGLRGLPSLPIRLSP